MHPLVIMGDGDFYEWTIQKDTSKHLLYVILLILGVVMILIFPTWPHWLKIYVFDGIFYITAAILSLAAVRLVLWYIMQLCGISFWLFPYMFDESKFILGYYWPIYEMEKAWG